MGLVPPILQTQTADLQRFVKRMMGLEPTTFCMASGFELDTARSIASRNVAEQALSVIAEKGRRALLRPDAGPEHGKTHGKNNSADEPSPRRYGGPSRAEAGAAKTPWAGRPDGVTHRAIARPLVRVIARRPVVDTPRSSLSGCPRKQLFRRRRGLGWSRGRELDGVP
jgi:hypothetical protein